MENNTPKHFVLQLGSLISLYLSLSFLLVLLFGVINLAFPDVSDSVWMMEGARSGVRFALAMVIVFFPTYLILTKTVNAYRRQNQSDSYLGLMKWLIYLSLLVGGITLLGDLVAVINTFLEGDITLRFILKALAVLVIIGTAFTYYLFDARGYWLQNESKSKLFAFGATVVVLLSIGLGLMNIETPAIAREQKIDELQITDLVTIQDNLTDYFYTHEYKLPENLQEMSVMYFVPEAPEERNAYSYKKIADDKFILCATFKTNSNEVSGKVARPMMAPVEYDWSYQVGETCFERQVYKK